MKKRSIRTIRARKRARKKIIARVTIIFISIVLVVTGIVTLIQKNFNTQKDVNAAVAGQSEVENGKVSDTVQLNENQEANKNEEANKNGEANKAEETNKDKQLVSLENDSSADDVATVEKFLSDQYKGIKSEDTDGKKVAYLTFDDGPSETITPQILDTLKQENVRATFFIMGRALDKSNVAKELLKREFSEGHAIGNHTYSHNYKYLYPNRTVNVDNFMADVEKTNTLLKSVLGDDFSTRAIRFPGGHMSWKGMKPIDDILASKDYHQVDWNALSKDAEGKPKKAPELLNEVIQSVTGKDKTVILMHDTYGKEETAKALPEVIKYLREQGYEFRIMK